MFSGIFLTICLLTAMPILCLISDLLTRGV